MRRLLPILLFLALVLPQPPVARGYIDMPVDKLTLPRLMLEFRNCGVYRIERLDADRCAVHYRLVDTIVGNPRDEEHHLVTFDGSMPPALKGLKAGDRAVLFGPDPYRRSLTFANDTWYLSGQQETPGWWRIAYTAAHYDFGCAFAGTLPQLIDACNTLLDGEPAVIPSHAKPAKPEITWISCTLRDPHHRTAVPAPTTRAAPDVATTQTTSGASVADLLTNLRAPDPHTRLLAARELTTHRSAHDQWLGAVTDAVAHDKDAFVRRQCAVTLRRTGADARSAVPVLLARARDGYEDATDLAGWEAARAVAAIDPDGAIWLPIVRAQSQEPDVRTRRGAVHAIGTLGVLGRVATSLLVEALKDSSADVRHGAARALDKIGADPAVAVPALLPLLSDANAAVVDAAANALQNVGSAAVPALGTVLTPDHPLTARRRAAGILRDLGPAAKGARAALESAANTDPDPEVRTAATAALRHLPSG